jgi:hypothetical protein
MQDLDKTKSLSQHRGTNSSFVLIENLNKGIFLGAFSTKKNRIYIYWRKMETFKVLNKNHMVKIVNESYYFNRMSKYDLLARNASSIESYKKIYLDSIIEFTPSEIQILKEQIKKIDLVKFTVLRSIPWKFSKVKTDIEQGWPHTLADVIILNSHVFEQPSIDLFKTLVHEKIHVYQRLFPLETHVLITDYWKFNVLDTLSNIPRIRNNPDINNFVYGTKKKPFYRAYNTENPSSLQDTHLVNFTITEHPYELMAHLIPQVLTTKESDFYIKQLIAWLRLGLL